MKRLFRLPFSRDRVRRDVDTELSFHLEGRIEELVASGMPREEAEREAQRRFGDRAQVEAEVAQIDVETHRRRALGERIDVIRQDVVFALRQLRKSPAFTLVAVLTLALGIGANSAIFSVVYGVLLKPLPYENGDRIVSVAEGAGGDSWNAVTFGDYATWKARQTSFDVIGASTGSSPLTLTGVGDPAPIAASRASADYWKVMHIPPVRGRYFSDAEDREGAAPAIVVSYALWQHRLDADPAIIGRTLMLNGFPHVVIGVASPEYILYPPAERIWIPLAAPVSKSTDHTDHELSVFGLLRPGVPIERGRNEIASLQRDVSTQFKDAGVASQVRVQSLAEAVVGPQRTLLLTLLGAVALVLLIVCANVANLLIARAAVRRGEIAIRAALGASRARIVSQLLVESLLLGLAGGVLGIGVAVAGVRFLVTSPVSVPRLQDVHVDGLVLAFAFMLSVGCAVLFGLLPALRAARLDLQQTLRDGGRESSGAVRERSRAVLVIGELCLTQVLVIAAGLLIRSAILLESVSPGFAPNNLLVANILLPSAQYPSDAARETGFQRIEESIAAVPGVQSVGRTMIAPIHGGGWNCAAYREGTNRNDPSAVTANVRTADPNYFSTIGAPLLLGRMFTRADAADGAPVVIVNQTLARRLFGNANPVGKRVANCINPLGDAANAPQVWREIVGVTGDMHANGLGREAPSEFYLPSTQFVDGKNAYVIRGSVPVTTLLPSIRRAVSTVDPMLALSAVSTMDDAIGKTLALPRFTMWLLTLLGAIGLVLALVGVYGVISYLVTQRTREVGIRIALGADSREIQWMLVRQGLTLGLAGVAVGSVASLATTRYLSALMFGITAHDPITFSAVALLLVLVVAGASWLPARRATRIDPLIALRGG
jgi:putative ABC transport system permease protein